MSVLVAVSAVRPVSADVARAVVPDVSRQVAGQVLADSRTQSAGTYRDNLHAANADLARRGLPIVGEPGPTASSGELLGAWVTARVLGLLPPSITDDLREQVAAGQIPRVLPSAGPINPADLGDSVVTVLPNDPGGATVPIRPGQSTGTTGGRRDTPAPTAAPTGAVPRPPAPAAPAAPAPPAPSPPQRGVLPLLPGLPLKIPLISE